MCQWEANRNPRTNGHIPDPHVRVKPKAAAEKFPFQIAAKRSEIDENVIRARLIAHFLALN